MKTRTPVGFHNRQYRLQGELAPRKRRHHLAGKPSNNRNTEKNFPIRFWRRVKRGAAQECWLWTGGKNVHGRGQVHLRWVGPKSIRKMAPVVAWELTHGEIPDGKRVCHRCDNPTCCNPSHLFLGTQAENVLDCIQKGRRNAFGRQRLTESDVLKIRALAAKGQLHKDIAPRFGVRRNTVTGIVNGASWRHLAPFNEPIGKHQARQTQAGLTAQDVVHQVLDPVPFVHLPVSGEVG